MYPEQSTQQTPIDYLNQIAPQPQKPARFSLKRLILIAGTVLIVIILFSIFSTLFVHNDKPSIEQLAARLQTTSSIAGKYQNTIKDSTLQSLNVTLQLYLTNTNRDIVTPLAAVGVNTLSLDKTIVTNEAGTTITSRLEDARLNGVFDNTYANEMSYQLSTIITLMQEIYSSTGNQALKSFLNGAHKNLTPIQKQLSTYNSTSS